MNANTERGTPTGENAAEESVHKPWRLALICCGRDDGVEWFATYEEADAFRESYTSGPGVDEPGGHDRSTILDKPDDLSAAFGRGTDGR